MAESLPELLSPVGGDPRLALFGRFVGSWDMRVEFFDEQGERTFDGVGRWDFAWILDGRAIQDVLQYDLPEAFPADPGARRIGTTIRSFHPSDGSWRQVWVSPRAELFIPMTARAEGDDILVSGIDMDGSFLEWRFTEMTPAEAPTSFTWTGLTSTDRAGWRVEQVMRATRRV